MQNCINYINIKELTFNWNEEINKKCSDDKDNNSCKESEEEFAYSNDKKNLISIKNVNKLVFLYILKQ